jgi:hypothetical protein
MAFGLFVNAAKGISRLQLSRNLGLHAKTAFVFSQAAMRFDIELRHDDFERGR